MMLPDEDIAPPNRTALLDDTIVIVCPNLGEGTSPVGSSFLWLSFFISIQMINQQIFVKN